MFKSLIRPLRGSIVASIAFSCLAILTGCNNSVAPGVLKTSKQDSYPAYLPKPEVVRLWQSDAPGALGKTENDIPTLTIYRPMASKATGAAMVICPGGGYAVLSTWNQWLSSSGDVPGYHSRG